MHFLKGILFFFLKIFLISDLKNDMLSCESKQRLQTFEAISLLS